MYCHGVISQSIKARLAILVDRDKKKSRLAIVIALLISSVMSFAVNNEAIAKTASDLITPNASLQSTTTTPPDPGWYQGKANPVSPKDARRILGESVMTEKRSFSADSGNNFTVQSTVATPSDYSQLALALENDPLKIYQYVRNNFEYVPYFGSLKGPYLTLHERSGNDFDQSSLLVELLRAAGYTANFRYGLASVSTIDPQQLKNLADWLGTDEDAQIIADTFSNGGVPVTLFSNKVEFNHVWVEVLINNTIVSLDPSFKPSIKSSTIDLDAAMGFNQSNLLVAAGGNITTDSIANLNESSLASHLSTLTTQLNNYLKQHHANDSVDDVIGGYEIVPDFSDGLPTILPLPVNATDPVWASIPVNYIHTVRLQHGGIDITYDIPYIAGRKLSISYAGGSVTIVPPIAGATDFGSVAIGSDGPTFTWSPGNPNTVVIQVTSTITGADASAFSFTTGGGLQNIPANGSVNVGVKFSGAGQTAGRKNAVLTFNYSHNGSSIGTQTVDITGVVDPDRMAEIYLDDVLDIAEVTTSGNLNDFIVTINHPYAANSGTLFDQAATFKLDRSGSYVLASAFGGDKHSTLLAERQRLLSRLSTEGFAPDSRQAVSETLNVIGQTWMQQTQLNADMVAAISGVRQIDHHRFGIVGQEEGYFVDVKAQFTSTPARTASAKKGGFQTNSYIASAMEHSVLEQTQGVSNPGISTIKIFALNNQNSGKLFLANSANFASIKGQLVDYTAADLSGFQSSINAGHTLVLPENGAVTLNSWSGKGYVDYRVDGSNRSIGMIIGGGLNGGFASLPAFVSPSVTQNEYFSEITPSANIPTPKAADPVDLGSGAFLSQMTDIVLGGGGPRGLAFSRNYNSQQVSQNIAGLGRGWNHNYNIYLSTHSDVESAFGSTTPFAALPLIVATHTLRNLMAPTQPTIQYWATGALIADWATDQLLNKSVTIHLGSQALTYRALPDGSFARPAGVSADLVKLGDGTFELRERFGSVLKFNTNNKIRSLTDIDGNALTFTYSSGLLSQVTDAYGRTLDFAYSGGQLASVNDSAARTVSYSYIGDNLIGVNGLEAANWQYSYDTSNRMLTVVNPMGTTIVNNSYDDFDRVTQQIAPRQTGTALYKLHYTGLSSSEEAPGGARVTYYYDYNKRTIVVENALGHRNAAVYDGQGHGVSFTDAKGHQSTLVYDANHNLVESHDPLNQVSSFVYDAQHRLIRATDPLLNSSETDFDAEHHPVTSRDAVNNIASQTYLANGLVASVTDPRNSTTTFTYDTNGFPLTSKTGAHPNVTTVYDNIGRQLSLTDQAGAVTSFTYDDRGLVESVTDPLNQTSSSVYNALGQLTSETDRNNETITASYTPTTKLDVINYPARLATAGRPAVAGFSVNFDYDINRDRLVSMTDQHGTTTNAYDEINRLTSHTDSNGHQVQYAYDELNNVTQLTYPNGKTLSYEYDTLNRVIGISIDWLNKNATPTYDVAGRLTDITHFNGTSTSYQYDNADRLTGLSHTTSGNFLIADYQFTLDANGNRTQVIINNEPTLPATLINTTKSLIYNSQKNRLLSAVTTEPVNFSYDAHGQTETVTGTTTNTGYVFDSAHRLTGFNSASQTSSYQYDGVGNRLSATRQGVTTQYIHDAGGNLIAEADATGTITRYYIHGLGLMAFVDAQTNQLYVYHHDATGHTVAVTDNVETIVNRYAYSPYGIILGKDEVVSQPFTYVGKFGVITESGGLYYMRARYYDANIGRFISSDPIGFVGGLNLYAYVGGNPVNEVDPSGNIICGGLCVTAIGIGVGFAFDYAIDSIRGSDNSSVATAGNIAGGAAVAVTSSTQVKPRTGISGGGPSGSGTSVASQLNHNAARRGLYSISTRNSLSKVLRKVPFAGYALGAYQLGDALYGRYNSQQVSTSINGVNDSSGVSGK